VGLLGIVRTSGPELRENHKSRNWGMKSLLNKELSALKNKGKKRKNSSCRLIGTLNRTDGKANWDNQA
jgi:hypothetical protein